MRSWLQAVVVLVSAAILGGWWISGPLQRNAERHNAHEAAMEGNTARLAGQVTRTSDVEARTQSGRTLLMSAAWQGRLKCVRLLLRKGADVNAADNAGRTALILVADAEKPLFKPEHVAVAKELLKAGARVHVRDSSGRTAVDLAASRGYLELAQLLQDWKGARR